MLTPSKHLVYLGLSAAGQVAWFLLVKAASPSCQHQQKPPSSPTHLPDNT